MERWCSTLGSVFESEVLPFVAGSDVFIDRGFAELLHWTETAAALLTGGGACSLREFSLFEQCTAKGAVFLLSSPLCGLAEDVLRDLVSDRQLRRILVLTSVSAQANALAANPMAPEDPAAVFARWSHRLTGWTGASGCQSEVRHIAFSAVPLLPRLWLMPVGRTEGTRESLSHDWTLVDIFNNLLETLKVREEIFAIGHRATGLATDLVNFSPAKLRRKNHQRRVALVLVDRALDLVSLTSIAGSDCPLDSIFRHLPPFAESVPSDVAVDLSPLSKSPNPSYLPSGCLCDDRKFLQQSSMSKQKDILMTVYRSLLDAAAEHSLDVHLGKAPSKISAEMLQKTVEKFRGTPAALQRHAGLLQLALALAQSMDRQAETASCSAAQQLNEKVAVQQAESPGEQEALLVRMLLQEAEGAQQEEPGAKRTYNFDEAVAFAIHTLSLIGPNHSLSSESWQSITVSLTHLLCEELHDSETPSSLVQLLYDGRSPDVDAAPDAVVGLMERLRGVQDARTDLRAFLRLVDTSVVPKYRPLIGAIAADCARRASHRTDPTPADYVYKSTGLKDLLRGGLSYFVSTSSPHPADSGELCLIAVLGPVSWAESRAVQEIAEKSSLQICLLCTGLGKCPSDLDKIFC